MVFTKKSYVRIVKCPQKNGSYLSRPQCVSVMIAVQFFRRNHILTEWWRISCEESEMTVGSVSLIARQYWSTLWLDVIPTPIGSKRHHYHHHLMQHTAAHKYTCRYKTPYNWGLLIFWISSCITIDLKSIGTHELCGQYSSLLSLCQMFV